MIGGCPRAGKTTLSVRLAKEGGYSKISLDSLSESLRRGFPEIVIRDWTAGAEDEYLGVVAERIHAFNIKLKEQCRRYSYRFIDTGVGEDRNIVLNSLYDGIVGR